MILTVEENDRQIRSLFPGFRLVLNTGFMGVWEGEIKPVFRTYKVQITYFAQRIFSKFQFSNPTETIIVLDPPIGGDPRGTGERAPHTYYWDRPADFPRLCVHDPAAGDWDRDKPIAETLIPFTIDWLLWHEDWVATGIWRGRGRHPSPASAPTKYSNADGSMEAPLKATVALGEFTRLGRAIGHSCSYDFMDLWGAAYLSPPFPIPQSTDAFRFLPI